MTPLNNGPFFSRLMRADKIATSKNMIPAIANKPNTRAFNWVSLRRRNDNSVRGLKYRKTNRPELVRIGRGSYLHGGIHRLHRFGIYGQFDTERRATLRTVETFDAPSVLLHDAVANAEPEAGAFAHGLGGEKRVEDLAREFYSRAGIGKFDDDSGILALGADDELAAADFIERVHRVA